jgi:hypothetical protein
MKVTGRAGQVRQEDVSDPRVVVDHLAFGEPIGIELFVEVGEG